MSEGAMSLRDTIVPKSDQLNYDDVSTTTITATVTGLAKGSDEQPVIVKATNDRDGKELRDYKPCMGMRRVLIAVWGDKGKDWIGKRLTLYGNPNVKWGGAAVGGIEISHMSGIDKPVTIMLTVSRGKRKAYVVQPIAEVKSEPAETDAAK